MFATRHAIARFQERVESLSDADAAVRIRELAGSSAVCGRPRWWTPTRCTPGTRFLYPSSLPGVCLVVCDECVVTVYERSRAREWARREMLAHTH